MNKLSIIIVLLLAFIPYIHPKENLVKDEVKIIEFVGISKDGGCEQSSPSDGVEDYKFGLTFSSIKGFDEKEFKFRIKLKKPEYAFANCAVLCDEDLRHSVQCKIDGNIFPLENMYFRIDDVLDPDIGFEGYGWAKAVDIDLRADCIDTSLINTFIVQSKAYSIQNNKCIIDMRGKFNKCSNCEFKLNTYKIVFKIYLNNYLKDIECTLTLNYQKDAGDIKCEIEAASAEIEFFPTIATSDNMEQILLKNFDDVDYSYFQKMSWLVLLLFILL
jgi:hypothetical protein